jgi:hypothetical protein
LQICPGAYNEQVKKGDNPNPVGHKSLKMYYNSVIKLSPKTKEEFISCESGD